MGLNRRVKRERKCITIRGNCYFCNMSNKKRFSDFSVTISVSLVLFVVGLFGVLLINTQRLTTYLHENVLVILYFDNEISESDLAKKTAGLVDFDYVKKAKYITGQEAAFEYKEVLGEDFIDVLGSNPLPASIEVSLEASKVDWNVKQAIEEFRKMPDVKSVDFQEDLIDQIQKNKSIAGKVFIGLAILLLGISLLLINNAIRLDVYAKRFVVNTMQLVGATEWFIIKPFLKKAFGITIVASIIASVLVYLCNASLTSWIDHNFFDVEHIFKSDITIYIILFASVTLLGILIVVPSTYLATKKYLRLPIDKLY